MSSAPSTVMAAMKRPRPDPFALCDIILPCAWSEDALAQVESHANRATHLRTRGRCKLQPPAPPPTMNGLGGAAGALYGTIAHNSASSTTAGSTAALAASEPAPRSVDARLAHQVEAILDTDYPPIKKLILVKIRLRCDHQTIAGAFPSYATLMRAASAKDDRTVRTAVHDLVNEGVLTRKDRPGQSSVYGIPREKLEAMISQHVARLQQKKQPLPLDGRGDLSEPTIGPPTSNGRGREQPLPSHAGGHHVEPLPSNGSLSSLSLNGARTEASNQVQAPHFTADGFVISLDHGLVVPLQKVQAWRERFPHIPDLEAAMTNLGTTILAKGRMHPGWTSPEGWMVKPLAEMNQEAADKKQIAAARVARAKNASAEPTRGKSRRAELDEA